MTPEERRRRRIREERRRRRKIRYYMALTCRALLGLIIVLLVSLLVTWVSKAIRSHLAEKKEVALESIQEKVAEYESQNEVLEQSVAEIESRLQSERGDGTLDAEKLQEQIDRLKEELVYKTNDLKDLQEQIESCEALLQGLGWGQE